ncbi:Brefeldin a-inhibited guanine nucleotide-exchange protein, partial [Globisporangium splendens]
MNSGGTEVFLCYKKTLGSLTELRMKWLQITNPGHEVLNNGAHLEPPAQPKHKVTGFHLASHAHPSTPIATSISAAKSTELRDTHSASPPALPLASTCEIGGKNNLPFHRLSSNTNLTSRSLSLEAEVDPTFSWKDAQEYYMYPLLLACYTRHGPAAEAALQGLSQCLDAGNFDETAVVSDACRLEVIVDAVASICHQAVKSRFAQALPFFRKVVRKCPNGFSPMILHAILKPIIFIGDFDSSLVKSVESEFVYKIMSRYEFDPCQRELAANKRVQARISSWDSSEVARAIVTRLIDDISSGCETAKTTEKMLGVFKAEMNALQLIITLSKAVHRRVANATEHGHDHDHLSIINSLRGLNVAFLAAGTLTKERQTFGQIVRRFVFSTSDIGIDFVEPLSVAPESRACAAVRASNLRILRSNAVCAVNHRMSIMQELTPWMQLPHNVVEFFLNFDMDRIHQWKTFEQVCCALCAITEGTNTHIAGTEESKDVALNLQIEAITAILAIARSVMDASGHAHLITRDARTRHLSMGNGGWEQDETGDESLASVSNSSASPTIPLAHDVHENTNPTSQPSSPNSGKIPMHSSTTNDTRKPKFGSMSVRMRNELQERNRQLLLRAKEIASSESLGKAIEYLVAMYLVKDSPWDVTSFLRMYHDSFDEAEIGDYLGEGDEDFKVQVQLSYVRAISFKGMTLVESLRHFLTNGGFRFPGEAQKIERMVEAFAQCYYEDSPASFSSGDTAMIIAYSIIMLNADLHNPQRFLEGIYEDIAHHPMHIKGTRFTPKAREPSSSLLGLESDKFRGNLSRSVAQFEELLKDLSQSYYTFNFVGVDACISPDLIKLLFERIWFQLLTLSATILCSNQSDLPMTTHCLDLLRFSISTCLFLGMPIERQAFCSLLAKVKSTLDENSTGDNEVDESQTWTGNIEAAAATDDPRRAIGDIHLLVKRMKDMVQRQKTSEELSLVIKRINRSHIYLKDTTRFIREGDLTKKCRSRNQTYRFFLFNDQLLYADKSMSGHYWNPHNSLRLKLTRIGDIPDNVVHKHAFQILNPTKSFIVYADGAHAKAEWIRVIEDAIAEAAKKINWNARRLSTHEGSSVDLDAAEGFATPSPPTPSSVVATASSAMETLMRRSSRPSPPSTNANANGNQTRDAASSRIIASSSAATAHTDHGEKSLEKPVEREPASDTSVGASTDCDVPHAEADASQQHATESTGKDELLDSGTSSSDSGNRELETQPSCEAQAPNAPSAGDLPLLHHAATADSECGGESEQL